MKTLLILTSLFSSTASFGCTEPAIQAIDGLANGLSTYSSPTIENANAIISIAQTCKAPPVRIRAAQVLRLAMSEYSSPTIEVANAMNGLCQGEEYCTLAAIDSLSFGISASYSSPTEAVATVIINLAYQAPYMSVRNKAIVALSRCISDNDEPTRTCRNAMLAITSIPYTQSQPIIPGKKLK